MKIKKIVSSLAAALLVSSLSALNYEVKADDTTDGYHYYVTQQDRYGQIVNYINEQHRLLNQYVVENVNAFDQLNAKSAVDRLNSAIASFKQTDDQLLAQLKVGRISNSNYNAIVQQRNAISQTVQHLVDQENSKLQTSQNQYAQLVGQRNQAVANIRAILEAVNYNAVRSMPEAEQLFTSLNNQVNPYVTAVNGYKAEVANLQQEVDAISTDAIEAETAKLAAIPVNGNSPVRVSTDHVEDTHTQPLATETDQEAAEREEHSATPVPVAPQAESTNIADYDNLKEVLRSNISNHVPHISVQMEFKTQDQVDEYQQQLGGIIRAIGDELGTATSFASQSRISTYTLGGEIQRIVVNTDVTITYTLKDDMVALHQEYKQFVDNFVRENITNKNITSDYEKAKIIHDHIVNEYTYATEELASNRETASGISIHAPEALYKDKRGVCQAYAVMFKDMATAAGLSAWYVTGKGLNENHAWNIVTIDGVNYYVDTTWNDSAHTTKYFLAGKDVMDTEHRLDSQYEHLTHSIPSTNYHRV